MFLTFHELRATVLMPAPREASERVSVSHFVRLGVNLSDSELIHPRHFLVHHGEGELFGVMNANQDFFAVDFDNDAFAQVGFVVGNQVG